MTDLVGLIDSKFINPDNSVKGSQSRCQPLNSTWSFELDDDVFQYQGKLSSDQDVHRHLQRIFDKISAAHNDDGKATVRLFRTDHSQYLPAEGASKFWGRDPSEEDAGKWVMRFSRKASFMVFGKYIELVIAAVTESLPAADAVVGCVFTCRKGKCEMELWMSRDPMEPVHKGFYATTEHEQQLQIRAAVTIDKNDKNVLIQYKQHAGAIQARSERRKVRRVQKKKTKQSTWPSVATKRTKEEQATTGDFLQHAKMQAAQDSYVYYEQTPQNLYQYDFSSGPTAEQKPAHVQDKKQDNEQDQAEDDDNDRPQLQYFDYSGLLSCEAVPATPTTPDSPDSPGTPEDVQDKEIDVCSRKQSFDEGSVHVELPRYSAEELLEMQQQQLSGLSLTLDAEKEETKPMLFDLSVLRSRLDSAEFTDVPNVKPFHVTNGFTLDLSKLAMLCDPSDPVYPVCPNYEAEEPELPEVEDALNTTTQSDSDEDEFIISTVGRRVSATEMHEMYLSQVYKPAKEDDDDEEKEYYGSFLSASPPTYSHFGTHPPNLTSPLMRSSFHRAWE